MLSSSYPIQISMKQQQLCLAYYTHTQKYTLEISLRNILYFNKQCKLYQTNRVFVNLIYLTMYIKYFIQAYAKENEPNRKEEMMTVMVREAK